jgi:hypothetical protein
LHRQPLLERPLARCLARDEGRTEGAQQVPSLDSQSVTLLLLQPAQCRHLRLCNRWQQLGQSLSAVNGDIETGPATLA